jgi:hypothetical protein
MDHDKTVIVAMDFRQMQIACEQYFGTTRPPRGVIFAMSPTSVRGLRRPNIILGGGWSRNRHINEIMDTLRASDY